MPGCLNNKSIITRELEGGNTFITICAAGFGGGMEINMNDDFNNVNLSSYYFCNPELREYYLSLSKPIRDRLDKSDVEISTLGELKQVAEHMIQN